MSALCTDDDDRRDSGLDVDLGISEIKEPTTVDTPIAADPSSEKKEENMASTNKVNPNREENSQAFDRSQSDTTEMKLYKKGKDKRRKKVLTSTPDIYKHCEYPGNRSDAIFEMGYSNTSFRSRCWTFSSMRSRQDIVGSVTKSYDLEENEDTFSYVSNYLPPPPPSEQIDFSLKNNSIYAATENNVLSNDMLYPLSNSDSSNPCNKEPEINGNIINGDCITPGKTCYV